MSLTRRQTAPINHIHAYFARYPDFDFREEAPFLKEFRRLANAKGWQPNSARRNEEREALRDAMVLQFNVMYGKDENDLRAWQAMCDALGVDPIPDSISSCRKVRPSVYLLCSGHSGPMRLCGRLSRQRTSIWWTLSSVAIPRFLCERSRPSGRWRTIRRSTRRSSHGPTFTQGVCCDAYSGR